MAILLAALVDTGADVTLVPLAVAQRLRLPNVDRSVLEGVGGRTVTVTVHAATIQLPGLRTLAPVISYGHEALIGRDLLARLALRLDGPAAELSVTRTRPRRR
jgi:predicted aspartyl protease